MARRLIITLACAFALVSSNALASDFPAVDAARDDVRQRVEAWRTARRRIDVTRAQYDELAHRIAALKRLGTRGAAPAGLERLLQQSLEAGQALESQARLHSDRANDVKSSVQTAAKIINDQMRALKPALRARSRTKREQAAKALKELIAVRAQLQAELQQLSQGVTTPKAWAQYEVEVGPLDSPDDLRGKADWLEDTRDQLEKKRKELATLLGDVRQEREIARAAENFATDLGLFDEAFRAGRVARTSNRATTLASPRTGGAGAAQGDVANNAENATPSAAGSPSRQTADPAPPAGPTDQAPGANLGGATGGGGASPNEPVQTPSAPTTGFDSDDGARSAAPTLTTTPPTGITQSLPKQIDPEALLNLRIQSLRSGTLGVEQMEALLADLARLDAYLASKAKVIRKRAETIESDEARALGIK